MLASKSNDHEGFYLLQTMIECMPAEALNQYIKGIFQLLFSRLTSSKTTKFVKSFLVFIFLYTCHHGGQSVQELIDSIQPNMFGMVIDRLVILEVQKVCLLIYFLAKRYVFSLYVKENLTIFEYEDCVCLVEQEIKTFGLGSTIGDVFSEI